MFYYKKKTYIGVRGDAGGDGGGGDGAAPPPPEFFQMTIFGQNHLTLVQSLEKIFGQETSMPPNKTGPIQKYGRN